MKRLLTLLMVAVSVFTVTGCSKGEDLVTEIAEEAYTAVEIESVNPMELHIENIMTGKTYADKDVFVVPMMGGKVERINVKVGDRVSKDQVLFVMNKEDIDKQVNQALAAYDSAKANYEVSAAQIENAKISFERISKLYEEGAVPETQYDQAKLAASDAPLQAAQKGLEQAKVAYENSASASKNAQVKAPISGVIANINIEEGEFASSSQPPMTIVDSDSVTVQLGIPGSMVNKIAQGNSVKVEIADASYDKEANIDSISTSSDPMTNLYTVKIILENDGMIKPGMFAKVYINTDKIENTFAIRTEAVMNRDDKSYVFVADGDKAYEKEVVTGLDTGEYIEIKSGLDLGDKVIIKGQNYVNDGSRIKIVRGE